MNDFGMFLSADGIENGTCSEREKYGLPVVNITERFFGDGSVGYTETATICERCLPAYVHH